MKLKINWASLLIPVFALGIGLFGALGISAILGENPLQVAQVLFMGAFGSMTQLGYSLYYATPLLLTGLAVSWAFRAGLFNIGAEGQMALGGVAMAAVGIALPQMPAVVAIPLALLAAFLVGGFWGAIAGWIKAKRGCHEVLTSILLNFIAYGLSSFFILGVLKNPTSQVPETAEVGHGFEIAPIAWLGGTSPLNWSLLLSIVLIVVYGFVFRHTRLGFYQRLAGGAPEVGRRAGISMDRQTVIAMFISGGIAALAAASPVLGFAHKTREGFTSSAGFVGIAVALLGRNSPIGLILSALLFGVLAKGALDLDMDTKYVSRDLATVIQALIVLAVASHVGISALWERFRLKGRVL
jgi:ABC-type uncharacterized transport system permease subunit